MGEGCCLAQASCCCGSAPASLCCAGCPPVKESTSTRIMYTLMFLCSSVVACLMITHNVQKWLSDNVSFFNATCIKLKAEPNCERLTGYMAVYRLCFAMVIFFFLMSVLTMWVSTSRSWRANIHNGFWLLKFFALGGLIAAVFLIPSSFANPIMAVWMYIGAVGAVLFIFLQLVLIIDFAHSLNDKIIFRMVKGGSHCGWFSLMVMMALFLYAGCVVATVILFAFYTAKDDCFINKVFISVNAFLCMILSLVSVLPCVVQSTGDPRSGLLQASMISAYIMYLTWTALAGEPLLPDLEAMTASQRFSTMIDIREFIPNEIFQLSSSCGPPESSWLDKSVVAYIGVAVMIGTVLYSSITTSRSSERLGIPVNVPSDECCCCRHSGEPSTISGGQPVKRNEALGVIYSYSFFHVVFCLGTFYLMMQLTNWFNPKEASIFTFGKDWSTVWVRMGSSWMCFIIYLWTLISPSCCPKRNIARTPRERLQDEQLQSIEAISSHSEQQSKIRIPNGKKLEKRKRASLSEQQEMLNLREAGAGDASQAGRNNFAKGDALKNKYKDKQKTPGGKYKRSKSQESFASTASGRSSRGNSTVAVESGDISDGRSAADVSGKPVTSKRTIF